MPPIITRLPIVIKTIQYHYNLWLEVFVLSVLLELFGVTYGYKVICMDSFYE